ncbi:MAG: MCP four helix bundle domain-containing protein [Chthoniobacterales bacterium]
MKISSANWSSWLPALLLLVVIGVLSSFVVSFFRNEADGVAAVTVPKMVAISMANKSLSEAYIATLRAVLAVSPEEREALVRKVSERSTQTSSRLEAYGNLPQSEEEQSRLQQLLAARQRYFLTRDKVLTALQNGQQQLAQDLSQTDLQRDFSTYEQLGIEMLEEHAATLRAGTESVAKRASVLQVLTGSISSALFLIAFLLGLFVGLILVPAANVRSVLDKGTPQSSPGTTAPRESEKVSSI